MLRMLGEPSVDQALDHAGPPDRAADERAASVGLEIRDQFTRLEMRAPVEGHVLDQVSQTLLVVGFEERAGFDRQPQRDALLRPRILPNEIFQPVGQCAGANGGIEGKWLLEVDARRRRLRGLSRDHRREQQAGEREAAVSTKIYLH